MIGLDTNVLVRYLVRDDEGQAARADRLIESHCTTEDPGRVALITLCELFWVLRRGYGYTRGDIIRLMRGILSSSDLDVENPALAWSAVKSCETGKADFADYIIAQGNAMSGAKFTYTFDEVACRESPFLPVP